MRPAIRVEWWKLRRSRVTLVSTLLMGLLLPAMGLGFYSVALNGGTGSLADKASALLVGEGWPGYMGLVDQIAAVAVFVGAGVVISWAFGREHADRTFPSLFALPVSRGTVAMAKFLVLTGWVVALGVIISAMALLLGILGGVAPFDIGEAINESVRLLGISVGAGTLALTLGLAASLGRGYLPAIGALIVIIAIAQVAVLFGTGGWFPYTVPGLMAVAGAEGAPELNAVQIALVPAVALVGMWLTVLWWRTAEVV